MQSNYLKSILDNEGKLLISREDYQSSPVSVRALLKTLHLEPARKDWLYPRKVKFARENTLSSQYGLGSFPLHSDFCTLSKPHQYIVLFSPRPRKTQTPVLDSRTLFHKMPNLEPTKALFEVTDCYKSFYSRLITQIGQFSFIRYHPIIMKPCNAQANEITTLLKNDTGIDAHIDWQETAIGIIDNWRCLHGRSIVVEPKAAPLCRIACN